MELAYSVNSLYGRQTAYRAAAADLLDQAKTASKFGFQYVEAGDHHAMGGGSYFQNVPTTARLTEYFDHVAVMFLLPLYHPIHVAEYAGTIAAFADDLDLWCGVGRLDGQYDLFDVNPEQRGRRFVECLEAVKRLWADDAVSFNGNCYQFENISVNPKADARFCLGGSAEVPVRRAARRGDAWIANAHVSLEDLKTRIEWINEEGGADILVRRDALALRDATSAEERAIQTFEAGYRGWPSDADWALVGGVEQVAEQLAALESAGADEVVVRPISADHAAETLEVVAEAAASI